MGVVRRKESNVEGIVLQLLASRDREGSIKLQVQRKETLHVCQLRLYRLWKGWPWLLVFTHSSSATLPGNDRHSRYG